MKKPTSFIVSCEVYSYDILFHFGPKESLFAKLKKVGYAGVDQVEGWSFRKGMTAMDDGNRTFVWMPNKPKTPTEYGTLSHEIFHATTMVLEKVGIELCDKSDEAFAYLIGYLTKQVLTKIKPARVRRNRKITEKN